MSFAYFILTNNSNYASIRHVGKDVLNLLFQGYRNWRIFKLLNIPTGKFHVHMSSCCDVYVS